MNAILKFVMLFVLVHVVAGVIKAFLARLLMPLAVFLTGLILIRIL